MRRYSARAIFGPALVVTTILVTAINPSAYTFTTLDYPGMTNTRAYGINNFGHIVGVADNIGFLWKDGAFQPIEYPGATRTAAWAINDEGVIVGTYQAPDVGTRGFLRRKGGRFITIEFPETTGPFNITEACGINNRGDVVGIYRPDPVSSVSKGYLLTRGVFTEVAIADAPETEPCGINSAGQIVGTHNVRNTSAGVQRGITAAFLPGDFDERPPRGFVLAGGVFTSTFPPDELTGCANTTPGCPSRTFAFGIDDALRVVGQYQDLSDQTHLRNRGYVLAGGRFTTIDGPSAVNTAVVRSNTAGTIVGYYEDAAGAHHGFVAIP
jgi:uncharacterized membrane protein